MALSYRTLPGSHEKFVVGSGKLGASRNPAVLDESPATAYEYMVDLFPCITAIVLTSLAVEVRPLEPRSSYPQPPSFRSQKHWRAFISRSRSARTNTWLISICVSARGCNEITQDDQGIPLGTVWVLSCKSSVKVFSNSLDTSANTDRVFAEYISDTTILNRVVLIIH